MKLVKDLFISARPTQWTKNLAVFAAIFLGGNLLDETKLTRTAITFVAFCLIASCSYFINDLFDKSSDRLHYRKKNRPVATGEISPLVAFLSATILAVFSLTIALFVSKGVFLLICLYLAVQLGYNLFLKQIILLELLVIAFGFMIRVFAGSFASHTALSSWLILTVMMLSLFLAIGKRRSEATLLGKLATKHRPTLSEYPLNLLDGLVFLSATSSLLTYSLYTFNQPARSPGVDLLKFLPTTLASPKWLMITIHIVVYGIFRYLYLIFDKK